MTEPSDRDLDPLDEPMVEPPVMDGAQELQAEAEAAIESGEVDVTDTRRGGPSVVEERRRSGTECRRRNSLLANGFRLVHRLRTAHVVGGPR